MFTPCMCGSLNHEEEEEDELWCGSPYSSPKKQRRGWWLNKDNKNPYSTRGLDKFSELLADLEDKKQKIYSQMGSQDISFVRFAYRDSNDCVPIVVRLRNRKEEKTKMEGVKNKHLAHNSSLDRLSVENELVDSEEVKQLPILESNKKKRLSWNLNLHKWRRPSYYLPLIIVLILLCLAVFGRSFAILCTALVWYVVPIMKENSNTKNSTKKKVYLRRLSENKMATDGFLSPKSNNSGALEIKSPRQVQRSHWKSW